MELPAQGLLAGHIGQGPGVAMCIINMAMGSAWSLGSQHVWACA